jgi:uncharacterized protein YndB with AHSA1/START domain
MNGKLERAGERWRLRFERELAHAPEQVWQALTEHEHLQAWFPQTIVGEWIVGAPLRFESSYGDFDGEVLAFQPPSLLEFRWGPDTIRFEVAPASGGERCTLTLLDTLAELGKAARDGAGWHVCLDALEDSLAGRAVAEDSSGRWKQVHPGYVEDFGPEASAIGPPEAVLADEAAGD